MRKKKFQNDIFTKAEATVFSNDLLRKSMLLADKMDADRRHAAHALLRDTHAAALDLIEATFSVDRCVVIRQLTAEQMNAQPEQLRAAS